MNDFFESLKNLFIAFKDLYSIPLMTIFAILGVIGITIKIRR
jgi:hypothetical protein